MATTHENEGRGELTQNRGDTAPQHATPRPRELSEPARGAHHHRAVGVRVTAPRWTIHEGTGGDGEPYVQICEGTRVVATVNPRFSGGVERCRADFERIAGLDADERLVRDWAARVNRLTKGAGG